MCSFPHGGALPCLCLIWSELDGPLVFCVVLLSLYFAGLRHYCLFSGTFNGSRPNHCYLFHPTDLSANGSVRPEAGLR